MNTDDIIVNNDATIHGKLIVGKDITATGQIEAKKLVGDGAVISHMIVMWSGTVHDIPDGWVLCDGDNDTPDLRSRFIVGVESDSHSEYKPGSKGEADTHTHNIQVPSQTYNTSWNGTHTHKYGNWYGSMAAKGNDVTIVDRNAKDVKETDLEGGHNHSVTIENKTIASEKSTGNNRPKWYAICFIMKK